MLKILIDFLASNWAELAHAPLVFAVVAAIGFLAGTFFLKNQNDALKERLSLREDQVMDKDEEIEKLKTDLEQSLKTKQIQSEGLTQINESYALHLKQLSELELSQEAQKMSKKLGNSARLSIKRQGRELSNFHIETGLYNEWLSEGQKLLSIKRECLKRLPANIVFQLDQISDSRYVNPAFQTDSILDAVAEIQSIALKLSELTEHGKSHDTDDN